MYFTTGSNDVVLITEAADGSDAVATGVAVAATGSISKVETGQAWSPSEFEASQKRLPKYPVRIPRPGD